MWLDVCQGENEGKWDGGGGGKECHLDSVWEEEAALGWGVDLAVPT